MIAIYMMNLISILEIQNSSASGMNIVTLALCFAQMVLTLKKLTFLFLKSTDHQEH